MVNDDLDRLMEPLRASLLTYCYLMLRSMRMAGVVVADVYSCASRNYAGSMSERAVRLWLFRLAAERCVAHSARCPADQTRIE
jgi:DNA-directed RNA polymerase specialized sigma24 family protein